jgi:hypothetical protein
VLALVPGLRRSAVENRRFLRRVVRFLAAEAGVSQFLDIGVGLPTQGPCTRSRARSTSTPSAKP